MKKVSHQHFAFPTLLLLIFGGLFTFSVIPSPALAAEESKEAEKEKNTEKEDSDKLKPFDKFVPDAVKVPGLIDLYQKKDSLYAEITSDQLEKDYIIVMSIAKGIGNTLLYSGKSLHATNREMGDEMIWQFRKVDDRVMIVRRNYRYQADSGTTEEKSVKLAYTDSIIFSLPIVAAGPDGGDMVDLTPVFMSDLPNLSRWTIPGFTFVKDRSNWDKVKGFTENVELEVAATYSSENNDEAFDGIVLDGRGLTVNIHYSISKLPDSGYKPRVADERVGYFTTAIKNLNKNPDDGNFVRYINRWNLQKLEPGSEVSLPKKPIVFWLDKNMPYAYRKPIRDGILEWNKAFEKAGFYNAIEVRQQEDNDTWDPEDIRYNTIRWSPANLGFAIGPSRVNPMTGEILDADVVIDCVFAHDNNVLDIFPPSETATALGGRQNMIGNVQNPNRNVQERETVSSADHGDYRYMNETLFFAQQLGIGNTFLDVMQEAESGSREGADTDNNSEEMICPKCGKPVKQDVAEKEAGKTGEAKKGDEVSRDNEKSDDDSPEYCSCERPNYENERKKLVEQNLRWVAAHEVGHTLGLRHNFIQSSTHSLDEIRHYPENAEYGYGGSAMDYIPVNIAPEGEKQGDYFPKPLGAYDYWAIKYGYQTFGENEDDELKKIASEQSKPAYNYATDEECYLNGDPRVNPLDLGDPLEYAKLSVRLFNQALPKLNDRIVKDGESYRKLSHVFKGLFSWYGQGIYMASRFIGGLEVNRDFKGDPDGRPTFVPTPSAKQREALDFVVGELFSAELRRFSPNLLNNLAPNRWMHWGTDNWHRFDPDIEELVLTWHRKILEALLSPEKLGRIIDTEYRTEPGTDILTAAELFDKLTGAIFTELDREGTAEYTAVSPAVETIRRSLQREYSDHLVNLVIERDNKPSDDISPLARYELENIQGKIEKVLSNADVKLDINSAAHLNDLKAKIEKTLNADFVLSK